MENINAANSIHDLVMKLQMLPECQIRKVQDFIESFKQDFNDIERAWDKKDSLRKSQPLHLGKTNWNRDDLYDR